MELVLAFISIIGALTIGAISPGPSFVLVAQKSVSLSRRDGIACALGMGFGGFSFALLALLGLHAVLTAIPLLYFTFKIVGGLYLIYLAYRIWRGATQPLEMLTEKQDKKSLKKSFYIGLFTQLSNPKTAIVYASTFAAFLPRDVAITHSLILIPIIFCIESGWYTIVAVLLSSRLPRQMYLRSKTWIDRITAGVLAGLGIKLILGSRTTS